MHPPCWQCLEPIRRVSRDMLARQPEIADGRTVPFDGFSTLRAHPICSVCVYLLFLGREDKERVILNFLASSVF